MTDVNYASLWPLTQEFKRASIDAYMKSHGWILRGDKYEMSSSSTSYTVTRPGADGEGGGDWETNNFIADLFTERDDEFRGAFDGIRSTIDNYLSKWEWLPDPADLAPLVESMRQANRTLSLGASATGGTATGGGSIGGNLTGIEENSDAMAGLTITAFKSKFLFQLRSAIGGHHAITVVLGGALAGQEKLWTEARQTVADTVSTATKAMQAYADGDKVTWGVVLKVAGWAVKGVSAFATGGATAALSGAGLGIEILQDVEKGQPTAKEPESKDYEGIMSAFGTSLDELDSAITAEEQQLQDNLTKNLANITNDQGSYDLTKPAIIDITDDSQFEGIVLNQALVNEITDSFMPAIGTELGTAGDHVWSSWSSTAYSRDSSIGVGQFGPSGEWFDVNYLLYKLVTDLKWEVENGAKSLKLAIEDMGRTDSSVKDELEKHAEKAKTGSGWEPFN